MIDVLDFVMRNGKNLKLIQLPKDVCDVDELIVRQIEVDETLEISKGVHLDIVDVVGGKIEMRDRGC